MNMGGLLGMQNAPLLTGLLGAAPDPLFHGAVGLLGRASPQDRPPTSTFDRNQQWATPGPYITSLPDQQEAAFRQWVQENQIPFDPANPNSDYDMRGYWLESLQGSADPRQRNENDGQLHFTDKWKTPFHRSFSNESVYARQTAPGWANDYQLVDPASGAVVFDERAAQHAR